MLKIHRILFIVQLSFFFLIGQALCAGQKAVSESHVQIIVKFKPHLAEKLLALLSEKCDVVMVDEGDDEVKRFSKHYSLAQIKPLDPHFVKMLKTKGLTEEEHIQAIQKKNIKRAKRVKKKVKSAGMSRLFVLEVKPLHGKTVDEIMEALNKDERVEYAEKQQTYETNE